MDDRRLVRVWAQNLQKKELNTVSFYRVQPAFSAVLSSVRSLVTGTRTEPRRRGISIIIVVCCSAWWIFFCAHGGEGRKRSSAYGSRSSSNSREKSARCVRRRSTGSQLLEQQSSWCCCDWQKSSLMLDNLLNREKRIF